MDLPPPSQPASPDAVAAAAAGPAPFVLSLPARRAGPVLLASPHSGRDYPDSLLADARLAPPALRRSEDGFVEELFGEAPGLGLPLLAATFPRVWCDVNREPWELDPAMFDAPLPAWVNTDSPRVGAGLGTVARVVATGETIYRRKLRFAEAEARVRDCWRPYHAALSGLIADTVAGFGACLLLDCHSMPTHPGHGGSAPPDFVLGDAHGTACAPRATRLVEETLGELGYRVRRNDPYAGGYVTRHYGRPALGVHVLQVEIARALYMDEVRIERRAAGMATLRRDLTRLLETLAAADWADLAPP